VEFSDNYWSGGTKYTYRGLDLATGEAHDPLIGNESGGHPCQPASPTVKLEPGKAIVCHKIFCGKDHGLVFYIHPDNLSKLLPAPAELPNDQRAVLEVICSIKGGQYRRDEFDRAGLGEYSAEHPGIVALASAGLVKINRAGAVSVTVAGRNAR
jgi:hypothetical protein